MIGNFSIVCTRYAYFHALKPISLTWFINLEVDCGSYQLTSEYKLQSLQRSHSKLDAYIYPLREKYSLDTLLGWDLGQDFSSLQHIFL